MIFNGAQFHLLVNHLPVIGFIGAVGALIAASIIRSSDVKRFVLALTAVAGLSSLPALWTGEPAEEVVEHLPGIDEALIHEHEEAAEFATVLAVVTAVVAAGALFYQMRRPESLKKSVPGVLFLSLVTVAAMGKTAHDGGKIRHPEIRSNQGLQSVPETSDDDGDDD
jgi:hypothetical protein